MKNVVRAHVVQQALLTAALVATLVYPGIAAAVFVQPGTPAIVMTDNRMPLAGVTLTLTPVDGGEPINLTTGPNGEFCDDDDADNKNGQDDDEKRCAFIPDGKYRITGSLDGTVTITDGVPHFSRWTTWNNAAKGGTIAGGAALIGLGLSGGGGSGNGSGDSSTTTSGGSAPAPAVVIPDPVTLLPPSLVPLASSFVHTIGVSPCPQNIVTVKVTNTSKSTVGVSIAGKPSQVSASIAKSNLAPGESTTITLRFNCSSTSSFSGPVQVRFTAGGQQSNANHTTTGTLK